MFSPAFHAFEVLRSRAHALRGFRASWYSEAAERSMKSELTAVGLDAEGERDQRKETANHEASFLS
jgi:hypothetical protein